MFLAAKFTVAKRQKQPKCLSAHEWINKLWYIYAVGYYLAIKKEWRTGICYNVDGPVKHFAK